MKDFDYQKKDSQGTKIEPIDPKMFSMVRYQEYEASLLESNRKFWISNDGVAIYRRFRVPEVFSYACKDMKLSLALQLGALAKSMNFKADIANFLEPWYGVGVVAGAFGGHYRWFNDQAPVVIPPFKTVEDALGYDVVPIEQTIVGKHILERIRYFVDITDGNIPISCTDTQSPMNTASMLVESQNFFMSVLDNPQDLKRLLALISDLLISFTKKQIEIIGDALVKPGHGFASSRVFDGIGISDDVIIMLSQEQFSSVEVPFLTMIGDSFGGSVFHSCGNWSSKIEAVRKIPNLLMVDGAFSSETDPDPNPPEVFGEAFSGTNIVVNARIVGQPENIEHCVKEMRRPNMKMIVVTYCHTPEEQAEVYDRIHQFY